MSHATHQAQLKPSSALLSKANRRRKEKHIAEKREHLQMVEAIQHAPPKRNGASHPNGGLDARREALANAIEKRDADRRELSATDKAIAECLRRVNEAKRAIAAADKAVEQAKADAAKDLIIKEMTGVEPSPLNPRISVARAAHQQAQDDLDAAMEAHATLTKGRSGHAVSYSTDAVEKAIGEIVLPYFIELLEYYRSEQERLAHIKQFLRVLDSATMGVKGPEYRHWSSLILDDPNTDTSALKAAVAGLKSNPDTDLASIVEAVKKGEQLPHAELPPEEPRRDAVDGLGRRIRYGKYGVEFS